MIDILRQFKYPYEIAKDIALKEKEKRKKKKITQAELSARSGVSLASLKRFEQTGEISFVSLLKLAAVLDELDDFEQLFSKVEYGSIQDVIDERKKTSQRKFENEVEGIVRRVLKEQQKG